MSPPFLEALRESKIVLVCEFNYWTLLGVAPKANEAVPTCS